MSLVNRTMAGQRIRLLASMRNERSAIMPVEDGMPAGLEGTVVGATFDGPREFHQIWVRWDNGRSLSVMPYTDQYALLGSEEA